MSFTLYALLSKEESPPMSAEDLMSRLDAFFTRTTDFSSRFETIPFSNNKSVRLEWSGWSVVLTYSKGEEAKDDSIEINKRLGKSAPAALERIDRRIHVFFADDANQIHTTQIVDVMAFLESIDGAIIFDPQQNKLLNVS